MLRQKESGGTHSLIFLHLPYIYDGGAIMGKNNIVKLVTQFSKPLITELGYKLIKVEYVKEDNDWFLRFYIDHMGGITIEDCERVSDVLSKELDKWDFIQQHYFLEVSSAGLDRELHDLEDIKIHLNENSIVTLNNGEVIEGILYKLENNILYLNDGNNIKIIPMVDIKKIKLKFIF